jgi:hypothetical protein
MKLHISKAQRDHGYQHTVTENTVTNRHLCAVAPIKLYKSGGVA